MRHGSLLNRCSNDTPRMLGLSLRLSSLLDAEKDCGGSARGGRLGTVEEGTQCARLAVLPGNTPESGNRSAQLDIPRKGTNMNVWNEMDFSLNVIEKMHCSSHVNALLDNVEAPRLKPITQKSFEELQEELLDPAWLPDLEYYLDLL